MRARCIERTPLNSVAIILILVSAVTHAGWNLVGKRNQPTTAFFLLAGLSGGVLCSPILIFHRHQLALIPAEVWYLLLATSFFMSTYYAALAAAYRHGHMSVAYPLARSSPIIVVTVVTLVLGQGEDVTMQCVAGIVMVVAGCVMLPVKSYREWHFRDYRNVSCMFALVAAAGTAGYSIIDDRALRVLREAPELEFTAVSAGLVYIALEAWGNSSVLLLFVGATRSGRSEVMDIVKNTKAQVLLTGAGIYLTYGLVLISLGYVRNVSYVVAFRQVSIPIGALLSIWLLKEPAHRPKLIGVMIIFAGLVLVGTG